MFTMRSIGRRARSASCWGTLTSTLSSRSDSATLGRVIIFMYLQNQVRLRRHLVQGIEHPGLGGDDELVVGV